MNISSILGIIFGIWVMYTSLAMSVSDLRFFLDPHGILIVCGGTAAAASISFSLKDIFLLLKVFFMRVLGANYINFQKIINELLELNKKAVLGPQALTEMIPTLKNKFLKESVELVSSGVLSEQDIRFTLEQRLKTIEFCYFRDANMFRIIGKFPPAFGLLATTLGMIGLLQKIGSPDSQKLIGPAMSIGLVGTLYGIALANLIFIPIAENLTERTHEEIAVRRLIIEGVLMLKLQVNTVTMRERLNSFVLPKNRAVRKNKISK